MAEVKNMQQTEHLSNLSMEDRICELQKKRRWLLQQRETSANKQSIELSLNVVRAELLDLYAQKFR